MSMADGTVTPGGIVTIGEILVEIMATEPGQGFREPIGLIGPFPSGATAIFIDQVGKLGFPCGIVSCVGEDDFATVNIERLARDGVDVSAIAIDPSYATGSAFVRYRPNGDRDFVYNIRHSASGQTQLTEAAQALLRRSRHLHIMGSSLASPRIIEETKAAIALIKAQGGSISFDPNIRKEMLGAPGMREALTYMLSICDIFLPSGQELTLLTEAKSEGGAVAEILGLGVSAIVIKLGAEGAVYHDGREHRRQPAFAVTEIDPTGAGDCFGATFVTCRLQGRSVSECLRYAAASGALAVTRKGPMEGTASFAELDAFILSQRRGLVPGAPPLPPSGADILAELAPARAAGQPFGITSVCSANPFVIEAALLQAKEDGTTALIEATCNQVNQYGGYTGMTAADFRDYVYGIAQSVGFPQARIILGGDHLGPNPWKSLPAEAAMAEAEIMVESFLRAGFLKIHLDCSMGCAGEPVALADAVVAERAARLASVAERVAAQVGTKPYYIIGTEVPTPGGALEAIPETEVTDPEAPLATYAVHKQVFSERGLGRMLDRVVALVVQPGVEHGNESVTRYVSDAARDLTGALAHLPGLIFEAHATDYQTADALSDLVRDGFPILKVGPSLTFALREALYGLDEIAAVIAPEIDPAVESLAGAMEQLMMLKPEYWRAHYHGNPAQLRILRHYSYSDRIRYYWPEPEAVTAVARLFARLDGVTIPEPLISQYLPRFYDRVAAGTLPATARGLAVESVRDVLRVYAAACRPAN
ncbi:D-tagatose-bisphosphate aldolase, class II, non-catalytic subunit [Acidisoma silvae]|nr:D-tagatose-bisphosphate aldolase, class II, non-catalytic subunit [Acidisoma silvae]